MSANYVPREVGYAMHGWGHGDRATNEAFRPLDTYEQRLDELLADIRELGFDAIDLWGAHLNPVWATDDHIEIALAVGTTIIAGFAPVESPLYRSRGLRVAVENHPEKTPAELGAKIGDQGATVDTHEDPSDDCGAMRMQLEEWLR
jgi:hypothetical protein